MKHPFQPRQIDLYDKLNGDVALALMTREILRNAKEHGATRAELMSLTVKGHSYALIVHDARPFESLDTLKTCMYPSTSGDNSGVQGSGMKVAMFYGADQSKAELLIHSRSSHENFSARLRCEDDGSAKVEDYDPFGDLVKKFFGEDYKNFNVFVMYRVTHGAWYDQKTVALAMDFCPVAGPMKIEFVPQKLGDGGHENYQDFVKAKAHRRVLISSEEMKARYVVDSEKFEVKDIQHPNKTRWGKFNALVELEVWPGVYANSNNLLVVNEESSAFGEETNHIKISEHELFVYLDEMSVKARATNGKDMSRLHQDPVYTDSSVFSLLGTLGISARKYKFPVEEIKTYEFLRNLSDEKREKITTWCPVIKVRVTFKDHPEMENVGILSFISRFGGIDEFFYSNNRTELRSLIGEVFCKLAQDNPISLREFRQRIKKHFPFKEKNILPIPIEKDVEWKTIKVYVKTPEGEEKFTSKVNPGFGAEVTLKFEDGAPVTKEFDSTVSPGFHLRHLNANTFYLKVDNLSRIADDGTLIPVTPEEFEHNSRFVPKKQCRILIGKDKYRLSTICNVPISDWTGKSRSTTLKVVSGDDPIPTHDAYYLGGNFPNEFGRISNRTVLEINQEHPIIQKIISVPPDKYPWIRPAWDKVYAEIRDVARLVMNTYFKNLNSTDFNRAGDLTLQSHYENFNNFYLNTHLEVYFSGNAAVKKLLEKIDEEVVG